MVETGFSKAKSVMIITDDGKRMADEIYVRLGRTVTTLEGEGLISGKKAVLYCVITQLELIELKKIVRDADQSAFVTVSDVSEIVGKHIKKNDMLTENGEILPEEVLSHQVPPKAADAAEITADEMAEGAAESNGEAAGVK